MNMSIPYKLRFLLQDESVANFTLQIFEKSKKENKFNIYPKRVNYCLETACADKDLWAENKKAYQANIDSCYKLPENEYIDLLIKEKIIIGKYCVDEDGSLILNIEKIVINKFSELVKWVKDREYLINYGLFSLNTLSGVAYFKDHKATFRPGTGYYSLFRELLVTKKLYLSFSEIVEIQQQRKLQSTEEDIKNDAIEYIKHLKRKLRMRSGAGKLLTMYERKGYALQSGLIS